MNFQNGCYRDNKLNLDTIYSIIYYKLSDCLWVCGFVCDRTPPKRRLQS